MSFSWDRMYKHEENVERDVVDRVEEYVCDFYEVNEVELLSPSQFEELEMFYREMNEYSVMYCGFTDVINRWLDNQEFEQDA